MDKKIEVGDIILTKYPDVTARVVSIDYYKGTLCCATAKGWLRNGRTCMKIADAQLAPIQSMLSEIKASRLAGMIEGLFSDKAKAEIVFRQVWSENEKALRDIYGPESYVDYIDPCAVSISKEEAFSMNLAGEDIDECAAIYFIRKGVKAHYEEIAKNRQQSENGAEK